MPTTVTNQNKMCATCDLWKGPRQAMLPYPSVFVTIDSNSRGLCMGGIFNYHEVHCTTNCGQWKKWGPLK